MQTITDVNVLDQLLVVNLDVHIWSARKKLLPEDFGNAPLPPEELASLGSKRVCNPDDLKTFSTLKARATTLLERAGVRFLNGWAIPESRVDEIDTGLSDIRSEFNQAKMDFLNDYGRSVQEWIDSHPEWSGIIANSVVSEEYVRSRLDFRWQVYRVAPVSQDENLKDNLEEDVKNLGQTLYSEISKTASEIWHKCYEGKTEVTRKALSPLKSLYDKLVGLTFIEPRISPVASLIQTAISSVPNQGPITGSALLMLQGLTALLRNPEEIVNHGQKILEGQKTEDMLTELVKNTQLEPCFVLEANNQDDLQMKTLSGSLAPALENCGLW